jgi:hypothetical protein
MPGEERMPSLVEMPKNTELGRGAPGQYSETYQLGNSNQGDIYWQILN